MINDTELNFIFIDMCFLFEIVYSHDGIKISIKVLRHVIQRRWIFLYYLEAKVSNDPTTVSRGLSGYNELLVCSAEANKGTLEISLVSGITIP